MKIVNTYSKLQNSLSIKEAHPVFQAWGYTDLEIATWFKKTTTAQMRETARQYLENVDQLMAQIEQFFDTSLLGELVLIPSMGEIDGFARYDRGHHSVMLGIDFPDASLDYLKALTAHELSHVFRDHSPEVWKFLGKPLKKVTRSEYLKSTTGREHLVSEGLATLTSQTIFPEISPHNHHYYFEDEMRWCEANLMIIDKALLNCLHSPDPDPWQFYSPEFITKGSPPRTHYFWAARKIDEWIKSTPGMDLIKAHGLPANQIHAF